MKLKPLKVLKVLQTALDQWHFCAAMAHSIHGAHGASVVSPWLALPRRPGRVTAKRHRGYQSIASWWFNNSRSNSLGGSWSNHLQPPPPPHPSPKKKQKMKHREKKTCTFYLSFCILFVVFTISWFSTFLCLTRQLSPRAPFQFRTSAVTPRWRDSLMPHVHPIKKWYSVIIDQSRQTWL